MSDTPPHAGSEPMNGRDRTPELTSSVSFHFVSNLLPSPRERLGTRTNTMTKCSIGTNGPRQTIGT